MNVGYRYPAGDAHPKWKGGINYDRRGYGLATAPGHARADSRGRVLAHVLVAEQALGHSLPPRAVIHHRDENPRHNAPENLVICEDTAYHMLLHQRLRAYRASGHAEWRRCIRCHTWDAPTNLSYRQHLACMAAYQRAWRAKRKEANP